MPYSRAFNCRLLPLVLLAGCASTPPVNAGYTSLGKADPGEFSASVQGGAVAVVTQGYNGAGSLHFDPHVSEYLSIPVDAWGLLSIDEADVTQGSARVGLRFRSDEFTASIGPGIGINYLDYGDPEDESELPGKVTPNTSGYGFSVDLEGAIETRTKRVGASFAFRPGVSWNQVAFTTLWILGEINGAVFVTEQLGITLSGTIGPGIVFFGARDMLMDEDLSGLFGISLAAGALLGITFTPEPPEKPVEPPDESGQDGEENKSM
jgi:hypothetical protein